MTSLPQPPPKPPTAEQLQKELNEVRQQYRAVSQYLWMAIEALHGTTMDLTLDTSRLDPLWQLVFMQVNDAKGELDPNKIQILAATLPPLTEQEKKRLVRRLRGTDTTLLTALQELKLVEYPPYYVEKFMSDRIVWNKEKGAWDSVTPPSFGEKVKNFLHLPHTR